MRRLVSSVVLVASALPFALGGSGAAASGGNGVVIPATPHQRLLRGAVLTFNWSGYAVRSAKRAISGETGTFKVPAVTPPRSGFASTWVGIGGFPASDLIQAGITEQSFKPHYFAWWETLPRSAVSLTGKPVSPGDQVRVVISQVSSRKWKISLSDEGHWSWSKTVTYKSSRSTAEWILEAPTVNGRQTKLPGITTAMFGPTSTYVTKDVAHPIVQGNPIKVVMVTRSGKREATPSALGAGGQSFNDCAWAKTCSAP